MEHTDELKKQAVESVLEQRTIVETEIEENFFEKTRNMPAGEYNTEFEKKVIGHLGYNSRPTLLFRTAGAK